MKKYIPILLSLLLLAGCKNQSYQEKTYRQVSAKEAITMMKEESEYLIIDVRTLEEFNDKHIPEAINITNAEARVSGYSNIAYTTL